MTTIDAPRRMDLRLIARKGQARQEALRRADEHLDAIVDELVQAGDRANVNLAAKLAGVPRSTLYRRMGARRAR
jgi:transcriptional regulator of acetoin/glycerol metabolism